MNKTLAYGLSALVLAAGLGGAFWMTRQAPPAPTAATTTPEPAAATSTTPAAENTTAAPAPAPASEPAPAVTGADTVKDFSIGAPDAKVTIVEYAMFTCPHCKTFHDNNWAQLKAEYIDTGKVRFEFREVYFNRPALWAALVARCGGEMRYFGMVDMLFEKQEEWTAAEDPKVIVDNLKTIGRTAGMDDATMDICLQDMTTAQALVAHDEAARTKDGVEGTPTFFINGTKYSNMEYADLKAILDAELAK